MQDTGDLVYLRARPETLAGRLAAERASRPVLASGLPLEGVVKNLLEARRGAYEQAGWVVDTDDLNVVEVARVIERRLREKR